MALKTVEELVATANQQVTTLSPKEALSLQIAQSAILVDIRDVRELEKSGKVEGAEHAPRGVLEFWFDPTCEYHRACFGDADKTYVLFCALGWRSALAAKALQDMGFKNIAHVDDGFAGLVKAGASIDLAKKQRD